MVTTGDLVMYFIVAVLLWLLFVTIPNIRDERRVGRELEGTAQRPRGLRERLRRWF